MLVKNKSSFNFGIYFFYQGLSDLNPETKLYLRINLKFTNFEKLSIQSLFKAFRIFMSQLGSNSLSTRFAFYILFKFSIISEIYEFIFLIKYLITLTSLSPLLLDEILLTSFILL